MRRWLLAVSAAVILSFTGTLARAGLDFTITIGNATIEEGGTADVDVMIKSTSGAPVPLMLAGYTFVIDSLDPLNTHTLEFVAPPDPMTDPAGSALYNLYESDPNYVFFGMSANLIGPFPQSNGTISDFGAGTNNQFLGGDSNYDPGVMDYADRPITTDVLLVRLHLTAAFGNLPKDGDQYNISLVADGSLFLTYDQLYNGATPDHQTFTSNVGTVDVVKTAPVPEPGSFALVAIGGLAGGWFLRRRAARARSV